jgi:hypothetical protein
MRPLPAASEVGVGQDAITGRNARSLMVCNSCADATDCLCNNCAPDPGNV